MHSRLDIGRLTSAYHSMLLPTIPRISGKMCMMNNSLSLALLHITAINRIKKSSSSFFCREPGIARKNRSPSVRAPSGAKTAVKPRLCLRLSRRYAGRCSPNFTIFIVFVPPDCPIGSPIVMTTISPNCATPLSSNTCSAAIISFSRSWPS